MSFSSASRQAAGFFPGLNYVSGGSFLHRVHPLVKLALLICFSFTVLALSSLTSGLILLVILLTAYAAARLGLQYFWRKLRLIIVFGLMIVFIQVLAVKEGWLLLNIPCYFFSIQVWSGGLSGGLSMMLRFLNIIGCSYLFVSVTDPNRLAYALMQAGLPYRYGFMLITSLRFIPVFQLELNQIRNAQMVKGIDLEGASLQKLLRSARYLLPPLVLSALGKVDSLAVSMEGRAFGLYPRRSYLYRQELTSGDIVLFITALILFLALYFACK